MKKIFVSVLLRLLHSRFLLDEMCKQVFQLSEKLPQELAKIRKKMNEERLK